MQNSYAAKLTCKEDEAQSLVEHINVTKDWFHQFSFTNGIVTPGRDPSAKKLHHLCLPSDLSGKSVIDIGAYEGYMSFHCEARGAERVVACDRFVWDWPESTALPNFNAIHKAVGSKVERLSSFVEDLPSATQEKFDISLFLGVLYHTKDMIGYLEAVAGVTKEVMVLETFADCLDEDGAKAALYDIRELNNDSSNFYGPNLQAIEVMLHRVGFRAWEFVNFWDVNTREQIEGKSMYRRVKNGRLVIHAYK
ncbi:class I SAM-dependent methyltransferase [Rhizobium sp. PL01]|uniref:class I SAM-dependent methyltransferase n=1 Tax=Rhizobium sp. PL01 TaxID=3085631 RepID=UPI002981BC09|nr:DUF1698 domain-containing protein [Rhizobium sp. PL01]MDW5315024.1 DUF1698 domain-containing protein [Rhizobium sp. PL01]